MAVVEKICLGEFTDAEGLQTYFRRIFFNKCVDASRKNTTNKMRVHDTEDVADKQHLSSRAVDALKSLMEKELVQEVLQAISRLDVKCEAILTAWGRGSSAQEIAKVLGYKSAQVVRTSRKRCVEKLLRDRELRMED